MIKENQGSYVGGVLLGFFLGFVGVLIAILCCKERTKHGSLVGIGISILFCVIVSIIVTML